MIRVILLVICALGLIADGDATGTYAQEYIRRYGDRRFKDEQRESRTHSARLIR